MRAALCDDMIIHVPPNCDIDGATSNDQSAGHRCQLRAGLDHQQVPHFARDDGHLGIIAWCGFCHDGDGRCLRADARLVVFMQHVRVVMVAIVASIIARLWVHPPAVAAAAPEVWFAPIHALPLIETLVLVVAAVVLGPVSRVPAGTFLIPMFVGAVLQINSLVEIELPSWLLAASYLVLGWTIGLRFTREILLYAIRALPKLTVSILMLIAFCGGLAFALVEVFDIDPLTAYLATSPGGADSVAIIAASTNVDVGFGMAQQIARFMLVLIVGPALSRFVADQIATNVPNVSDKTPT
jgi:membrane AbrB-like protein